MKKHEDCEERREKKKNKKRIYEEGRGKKGLRRGRPWHSPTPLSKATADAMTRESRNSEVLILSF